MYAVCVFELPQREQKAKENREPDKTAPVRNPKETSAHNFSVSIATVAEALRRNKHCVIFQQLHSIFDSDWLDTEIVMYFVTMHQ